MKKSLKIFLVAATMSCNTLAASVHEMDDEYSKAFIRLSPSFIQKSNDEVPMALDFGATLRLNEQVYWGAEAKQISFISSEQVLVKDIEDNLDYYNQHYTYEEFSLQSHLGWRQSADLGYRVTEQYAELALRWFYIVNDTSAYDANNSQKVYGRYEDEGIDAALTYGVRTRWGRLGYGASITQYSRNEFADAPILRGELTWRAYSGATIKLIPELVGVFSVERFSLGLQTDFHFDYFF